MYKENIDEYLNEMSDVDNNLCDKIYAKHQSKVNKENIFLKFITRKVFAISCLTILIITGILLIFNGNKPVEINDIIYGTHAELNYDYMKLSQQKEKVNFSSQLISNIRDNENQYYKVIVYYQVGKEEYPDLYETKFDGYTITELEELKETSRNNKNDEQFYFYNSLYNKAKSDFQDLCSKAEYDFFASIGAINIENYTAWDNYYYIMEVKNSFFEDIHKGKGKYFVSLVPKDDVNIDIMDKRYGEYILGDCVYCDHRYTLSSVAVLKSPEDQLYGSITLNENEFKSNLKARYEWNFWFILNSPSYTSFNEENNFKKENKSDENYYGVFDDSVYLWNEFIINNLINSEVYICEEESLNDDNNKIIYVLYLGEEHSYFGIMREVDNNRGPYIMDRLFEIYRKEDLMNLYPEYFNLDTTNGIDIYYGIEQIEEYAYIPHIFMDSTPKNNKYISKEELLKKESISKGVLFAILSTYDIEWDKIRFIGASYPFRENYYNEELSKFQLDSLNYLIEYNKFNFDMK